MYGIIVLCWGCKIALAFLERDFISALFASCWAKAFAGRWEGGNDAKPCNRCLGWVSQGVQRRGPFTPTFPAPLCRCSSVDVNLWRFLLLSPSLACLFPGGLRQGLGLGVVQIAHFAFPDGFLGCELPVGVVGSGGRHALGCEGIPGPGD